MYWKFKVTIASVFVKDGFRNEKTVIRYYPKIDYSWHEAWIKCINWAISNCLDFEIVKNIESINYEVTNE